MERLERYALERKAFAPGVNDGRLSAHVFTPKMGAIWEVDFPNCTNYIQ